MSAAVPPGDGTPPDDPSPSPHARPAPAAGSSRRAFLGQAAATATVAFFWLDGVGDPTRRHRLEPTAPDGERRTLDEAAWRTLEAAQARILPSREGSPGAVEVNAIGYLDRVLAEPDIGEGTAERILEGARDLDRQAREQGVASFADLDERAQDAAIRSFEQPWERQRWLRSMISFTLEAFLGDPVHGGNVDETGWRWAQHRPGEPRPDRADWLEHRLEDGR